MESVENRQGSIESLPVVGVQIFRDQDLNKTTLPLPFREGKLTIPEYVLQTDARGEYV